MTTDQDRVGVAVRALADAVPVVPPPPAVMRARAAAAQALVEGRGRRQARKLTAPVLAGTAIAALVALAALIPGLLRSSSPTAAGDAGDPQMLPERFAGLSDRTADYWDSPPGPAIALYQQGSPEPADQDDSQLVVVGADGRTYRRVRPVSSRDTDPDQPLEPIGGALLSPDGSSLAFADGGIRGDVTVVDLVMGTSHTYPHVAGEVLAWSLDGREIAFRQGPVAGQFDTAVFDLDAGQVSFVAVQTGYPVAAAFSPDGRTLAVHNVTREGVSSGGEVSLVEVGGTEQRAISLPVRTRLATGGVAWSPDGHMLVVVDGTDDPAGPPTYDLAFLDATGMDRTIPGRIPLGSEEVVPLGWRSPDAMLVGLDNGGGRGTTVIAEVSLDGGQLRTVSQFSLGKHDSVTRLQLASDVLIDAAFGDPGPPLRGPWRPPWLTPVLTVSVITLAAALVAGLVMVGRGRAWAGAGWRFRWPGRS